MSFAQDPLGYIAQQEQQAAASLATTVLPAMEKLTHPDLSADWFISAYRISFALAVFVWVGFLGYNFLLLGRRRISGDDVVESMLFYTPAFFAGVIFGPLAGTALLALTGALTDSLVGWGIGGSVKATTTSLQAAIAAGDSAKMAGGSVVAIIVFAGMIVALLTVFLVLLVMLVTLYLSGAVFPLSAVWLVHPRQRSKGLRIGMVWIGLLAAHALIFLLLGVAFRMIGGLGTSFSDPGLQILANLVVAIIALVMATTTPFALLRFAPVGASSATVNDPFTSAVGGGVGGGYAESGDDSQTAQMARDDAGMDDDGDEEASGGGGGGGVLAALGLGGGATSSASMEGDGGGADDDGDEAGGAYSGAGDVAGAGAGVTGGASSSAAAAGASQEGDNEQGEGDVIGAGGAAAAAGAAGPAGLGALAAGAAMEAASATAEMAQSAGETAAEQMEHAETYEERHADSRPRR